ncbi:MAG: threonylcarbamoyl-AMP synthase [Deltaproteobacteria bacterium]|nr:MAG: threonylcarbamoyl-AMP synthase [Deltaproteobacteria bacterium]
MNAEHLYTWQDPPNERHLDQTVDLLRRDGVIALSTGTSWAFAVDPSSKRANQRLSRLKPHRDADRPYALLCSSISMASGMASIDGGAYRLLNRLWPGPYTVLLPAGPELPRVLKTKRKVVGVRVPDTALATLVVDRFGGPIVVTTVPRGPDDQLPTMGYEIVEIFGHALDLVLDLGEPVPGTETTVLDLTGDAPQVVRHGVGPLPDL